MEPPGLVWGGACGLQILRLHFAFWPRAWKQTNQFIKINFDYEHIIIDNASTDGTIDKIKDLASKDKNLKVIINIKNFGHIRSPFYGLLQSSGDATILMASDFQDPVEMIPKYIKQWEKGSKIVLGEKTASEESNLMFSLRFV